MCFTHQEQEPLILGCIVVKFAESKMFQLMAIRFLRKTTINTLLALGQSAGG
jgi:hypothetical protein